MEMSGVAARESESLSLLLARDLLRTMTLRVRGTEAILFEIERHEASEQLRTVWHHRPDIPNKEERRAAVKAFHGLVKPCIAHKRPGVFEVGNAKPSKPGLFGRKTQQYCLVHLIYGLSNNVRAVAAVIVRCKNLIEANRCLAIMTGSRS